MYIFVRGSVMYNVGDFVLMLVDPMNAIIKRLVTLVTLVTLY